ncbi:MAG: hypothetical protein AB1705_12990 [Verrucomicrobiota bacterium]
MAKLLRDIAQQLHRDTAAAVGMKTYSIGLDERSITCLVCGMTSWNLNDVTHLYCGKCHQFHEP